VPRLLASEGLERRGRSRDREEGEARGSREEPCRREVQGGRGRGEEMVGGASRETEWQGRGGRYEEGEGGRWEERRRERIEA
jgi:hypothetical protein